MILVTIGMNDSPYGPLFEKMDELAPSLGEQVVMQTGSIGYRGDHTECFGFLPDEKMQPLYDGADLIVCHAGIGSILNGLKRNIPLVLVPRNVVDPDVGEEDQQEIVARKVETMGRGVVVSDISDLEGKIAEARALAFPPYETNHELCNFLSAVLEERAALKRRPDHERTPERAP